MAANVSAEARALSAVAQFISDMHDEPPPANTFSGMVKPSLDGDRSKLLFAYLGDCSHWIEISEKAIQRVEDLPEVISRGHVYKAAKITLKNPTTDTENAFAGLAGMHRAKLFEMQQFSKASLNIGVGEVPACPDGTLLRDEFGNWKCV